MKKLLFVFVALLFNACNSNEDFTLENNPSPTHLKGIEENASFAQMKQFNDSVFLYSNCRTRGWWCSLGRALAVTGADIIGAAAGVQANGVLIGAAGAATGGTGAVVAGAVAATICGAGASYVAYCETELVSCSEPLSVTEIMSNIPVGSFKTSSTGPTIIGPTTDEPTTTDPIIPSYLAVCGGVHNIALRNIIVTTPPAEDESTSTKNENYVYVNTILNDNGITAKSVSIAYNNILSVVVPAVKNNFNYNSLLNVMKEEGMITGNLQRAYELFLEVFQSYPQNQEDIEFIVNRYLEIIKVSNDFDEKEKEALYMGLSIALKSPDLWKEYM